MNFHKFAKMKGNKMKKKRFTTFDGKSVTRELTQQEEELIEKYGGLGDTCNDMVEEMEEMDRNMPDWLRDFISRMPKRTNDQK